MQESRNNNMRVARDLDSHREVGREFEAPHGCTSVCKCKLSKFRPDHGKVDKGFVCMLWWWVGRQKRDER